MSCRYPGSVQVLGPDEAWWMCDAPKKHTCGFAEPIGSFSTLEDLQEMESRHHQDGDNDDCTTEIIFRAAP